MTSKKKTAPVVAKKPSVNPALPRVPVTINGETYYLEYDFNAIAAAETLTGINLFSAFDFSHLSVTKFRAMLYASLIKHHSDMSIEDAGQLVTIHTLPDLTVKLVEAWHGSRPEVVDNKGNAEAEVEEGESTQS